MPSGGWLTDTVWGRILETGNSGKRINLGGERQRNGKSFMGSRKKFVKILSLVILLICLIQIIQACRLSLRHSAQLKELRKLTENEEQTGVEGFPVAGNLPKTEESPETSASQMEQESAQIESGTEQTDEPVMLDKYAALYEENDELAGWLSIEGMVIDYPVMQCEDDEFYLHHDFYGEESKYGCLYVKREADLEDGTNFIIYGHNMKDGSMFGDLDLYREESFYREHPAISFDTLYEERIYDIVAVFRSQVYNSDDDVFKYYRFYQADTQEEFDDFYHKIIGKIRLSL